MYRDKATYFLILPIILIFLFTNCRQTLIKENHHSAAVPNAWYRNTFVYNVDVDAFKDSDGDGTGDFNGLIEKLDYLKFMGVQAIWLAPFQPSPDRDDGYDVSNYYEIDKRFGNEEIFSQFIKEAKKRNIKVIMDVVLNHTSINSLWYQKARSDSTSKYFDWYVWSKQKPKDWNKGMAFPGVQTETWTFDEVAKRYYFHRFYDFQPDLNFENPEVQKESVKILNYWLSKGVDGFRLDAVPFILDKPKTGSEHSESMLELLSYITSEVKKSKPDVLLLGEANVDPKEYKDYFGEKGERLTMMFNFYANQFLFYSLADENPEPFAKALTDTKLKPQISQWTFFLRNHDEIDLGRLSSAKRNEVYKKFGPENNMQLYGRGIRRRLAPMLHNPDKLRMAYSLLFSLPGTPVIRSGEEIGMGDDLTLSERLAVRTPMQWSTEKNAGFSMASHTFRPVISLGDYSYLKVNVEDEKKSKNSLLNEIRKLAALRRSCPEIGFADWKVLPSSSKNVLIIKYVVNGESLITIHNFNEKAQDVSFENDDEKSFVNLIDNKVFHSSGRKITLHLNSYGYAWFKGLNSL
jgi:maltose alpha-D-glucosyltransferase/alpha-amylase